ncbi:prolyl oligopeptidase family serine peptidase [Caballeronia sp. HLA56]
MSDVAILESEGGDPFITLESFNDTPTNAWIVAQTQHTNATFGNTPEATALAERLEKVYTSKDRLVACSRYGDWAYNIWQDEDHPLGIVRRTEWFSWLDGKPKWELILDVAQLDLNEQVGDGPHWTLLDFRLLYPTYDRALVSLSPGGSDAFVVRELDVEERLFVEDGFVLPDVGKHRISWISREAVYVSWDDSLVNPSPDLTNSGFPRTVRRWARGTLLMNAPVVFEAAHSDMWASASFDPIEKLHVASRAASFYETHQYWLDESATKWRQYELPTHVEIEHWNGWLFVTPRKPWNVGGSLYAAGTLAVIRRDAFLAGSRQFTELFVPSERRALAGIDFTKHWLIVSQVDDGKRRVVLMRPPAPSDIEWEVRAFSLPEASHARVASVDSERDDTILIQDEHFLTPRSLHYADLADDGPWQLLSRLPAQFDASELSAVRRHAIAQDGERIPYWLIGRDVETRTDARPCLLYGYGGFEIALEPCYSATTGIAWLERGGLYAVANIRGGGEFGPDWHQAALRHKRHVSFGDFISVAQALIDSGTTTSKQLAIRGASNGGLLVAACMVQRPELFGAVLSEVPLTDMARFHQLLQGASWIDEFGDPNKPADLKYLMTYSPYHNVRAEVAYPAVLFTSSTRDDRVHPAHARKMVARMQAQGHRNVWYLELQEGGHGLGITPKAIAHAESVAFTFLATTVGLTGLPEIGSN